MQGEGGGRQVGWGGRGDIGGDSSYSCYSCYRSIVAIGGQNTSELRANYERITSKIRANYEQNMRKQMFDEQMELSEFCGVGSAQTIPMPEGVRGRVKF